MDVLGAVSGMSLVSFMACMSQWSVKCVSLVRHVHTVYNAHLAESNSMRIECALIAFALRFEIRGRWASTYNDCATRVRGKSYAGAVVCCSVLILLFNCAQLRLKYRRDNRRRG